MAILNLSFNFDINVSVQVTDQMYITLIDNGQSGRNHVTNINTRPFPYANVLAVDHDNNVITIDTYSGYNNGTPNTQLGWTGNILDYYMFFTKDDRANSSGILGYYAQVEYRNYSTLPAEMFATATNFSESSK